MLKDNEVELEPTALNPFIGFGEIDEEQRILEMNHQLKEE